MPFYDLSYRIFIIVTHAVMGYGVEFLFLFVCLFFRTISLKPMQLRV